MQVPQAKLDSWVRRYGTNSNSYVLLEGPKSYFTSPRVDGFLAYQVSGGIVLIAGDPVCAPHQARGLIRDFRSAMMRPVGAYQVSPAMLGAFRAEGFADVQIGKEAIFDLRRFTLAGGKMELVRAATNKARRERVVVSEHHPFAKNAAAINQELQEISDAWLSCKGNHELGFVLGSLGLDHPSAKRYFIARSENGAGRIEGFVVCEPIYRRSGYYLDVTRRRSDAVRGTMDLLSTEILHLLGEEGFEMASMGLAPLALLDDPDLLDHPVLARLMRFVFDKVNIGYDFKLLYRYKAKYHPHAWEPRYFCFNQRRLSLGMLYAVIQVRNAITLEMLLGRRGFQEKFKTWKHAASFIVGFCWAWLSSSS
ncbi:MAG: phosphatidylglycerol lysyltransferase [Acidobacteriota bacterium]